MPAIIWENVQITILRSEASVTHVHRVSTMGKGCRKHCLYSERMRQTGMSEDTDSKTLLGMQQSSSNDTVSTVSFFGSFEDVEILKTQVQRLALKGSDDVVTDADWGKNASSTTNNCERESTLSLSSDDTLNCDECRSTGHDSNETFLAVDSENQEPTHQSLNSPPTLNNNHVSDLSKAQSQIRSIKAGLLMSPVLLTEDVTVDVGASNRFSSVLENISLPLLYLPTTKQIVNGEKSAGYGDHSSCTSHSHTITAERYGKDINHTPHVYQSNCNGSEMLTSFRTLVVDASNSGNMLHIVSSSNDFDRLRSDPERVTLNSIESFTSNNLSGDPTTRLCTDTSSLSSISTGTDFSVSALSLGDDFSESKHMMGDMEDGAFVDVNLHGRNSYETNRNSSLDSGFEDRGAKPKKKGFSGFLPRNLFSWKSKEESAPGWKLFGRIPPKESGCRDSIQITSDYYAKQRANQIAAAQAKGQNAEIMSTTALIFENRPAGLPTKSPEETEKHKQEYEAMIEAAKKKEMKDLKQKKRKLQQQRRHEDRMVAAASMWSKDILPCWESILYLRNDLHAIHNRKNSKKVRDLWWMGLPPNVRGKVWQMAIGNDLNITQDLYEICRSRAEDRIRLIQESKDAPGSPETISEPPSNKEASVKVIKLDVSRTFPQLCIFQKGGPYHDLMHSLLGAYACYRPDVGYVQGMSFIAAILLLNMDVADAFVCFANLLNRPCQVTFFRMDEEMMTAYYKTFEDFFLENLPNLYHHFVSLHVTPNLYLMEWIFLLFSKSLPLDVACRVWDVYCRDGEEFLFQTSLGILKFYEAILLKMDFIHVAQFLTKLPEDISADQLFKQIDTVHMTIDKKKFYAIFAYYKDNRGDSNS